jgi:hypothetical protein
MFSLRAARSFVFGFLRLATGWIIVLLLSKKDGVFCFMLAEVSNSLELCFYSGPRSLDCIRETKVVLTELRSRVAKFFCEQRS